jgi:hypothetical protein
VTLLFKRKKNMKKFIEWLEEDDDRSEFADPGGKSALRPRRIQVTNEIS